MNYQMIIASGIFILFINSLAFTGADTLIKRVIYPFILLIFNILMFIPLLYSLGVSQILALALGIILGLTVGVLEFGKMTGLL